MSNDITNSNSSNSSSSSSQGEVAGVLTKLLTSSTCSGIGCDTSYLS